MTVPKRQHCCDEFKYQCNKEFDPIEYRDIYHNRKGFVFTFEGETVTPPLIYCPFCGNKLEPVSTVEIK